jgi:SAM-dependent methyltransferase
MLSEKILSLLRCPVTQETLMIQGDCLVSSASAYALSPEGIPVFAAEPDNADARQQQGHYDGLCAKYLENLTYPHTQEYFAYLDRMLFKHVGPGGLGTTLEVCCGRGEALGLLHHRMDCGVGLDISMGMLRAGRPQLPQERVALLQGDATCLPLADASFDHVFTLGGVHHVNQRQRFFQEIYRVLKPGGRFIWREPVSDLLLWRAIRAVIYRVSPALDAETEHPLRYRDTVPVLNAAGFEDTAWHTYGFFGFCLFMNSDVLVFNRLFRWIPGIRLITRLSTGLDHLITTRRWLSKAGLQVIGVAHKPMRPQLARPLAA